MQIKRLIRLIRPIRLTRLTRLVRQKDGKTHKTNKNWNKESSEKHGNNEHTMNRKKIISIIQIPRRLEQSPNPQASHLQAACGSLEAGLRQLSRQGAWALGASAGSFGISLKGSFFQGSFMASFEASFLWLHTGLLEGSGSFLSSGPWGPSGLRVGLASFNPESSGFFLGCY